MGHANEADVAAEVEELRNPSRATTSTTGFGMQFEGGSRQVQTQ